MSQKIITKFKKIFSILTLRQLNSRGAVSIIELMMVLSISSIIMLANQGMFQSSSKGQKTNTIKAEMLGIDFRVKTILRSQQGCMDTLGGNKVYTSTEISSKNDYVTAQAECMTKGTPLKYGFIKKKFNMGIGQPLSSLGGATLVIKQARVLFLEKLSSPDNPDVDGIVCYQISTDGMKEGSAFGSTDANGQISKWHFEPISVKNVYDPALAAVDPDPKIDLKTKITACNSDISSVTSANCTSLGGEFVDRTNECSSINVNVAKDDDGKIIDTSPLIAGGSAITAQGNLSSSGHGVLCGSLYVGFDDNEAKIPTFCGDNLGQSDSGNLYVGKNITAKESIMTDTGIFASNLSVGWQGSGKAIIDNTLEVPNSLTAVKGLVQTESLSVNGTAELNRSASIKETLKVGGKADLNGVVVTSDSISSDKGLRFFSGGDGEHVFYSKLKAIGDDPDFDTGAPDFLATMTYVNRLMLSTMKPEDSKKLFQALLKAADERGIDILREDFLNRIQIEFDNKDGSEFCSSATAVTAMKAYYDPITKTTKIKVSCDPVQPPTGTPKNCKWYNSAFYFEQRTGRDPRTGTITGYINYPNTHTIFKCPDINEKPGFAMNGTCNAFTTTIDGVSKQVTRLKYDRPVFSDSTCKTSTDGTDTCTGWSICGNRLAKGAWINGNSCNAWQCFHELLEGNSFSKTNSTKYNSGMNVLCCEL